MFWVTTVRADGRPHMTPLVAVWDGGALHFCTGSGEQKAVNLRGNRHVILSTGCNAWDQGLDVMVEGDAVQVTDDDTLARLAGAWRAKWDGRWQYQVRDGFFYHPGSPEPVQVFAVAPAKVLAFARAPQPHPPRVHDSRGHPWLGATVSAILGGCTCRWRSRGRSYCSRAGAAAVAGRGMERPPEA
jgi:general stress protein 26